MSQKETEMSQIELIGADADETLPPPPPSARDIARLALADLIKHASNIAEGELAIEHEHATRVAANAEQAKRALWDLDQRSRSHTGQLEQKYADHVHQTQSKFDAEMRRLRQSDQDARRRATEDRDSVERNVKKEFDEASWLAESLFDGEHAAMLEEGKIFKDKIDDEMALLDGNEAAAAELMRTYHQPTVRVDASEEQRAEISANADGAWERFREEVLVNLKKLGFQPLAKMYVGITPLIILVAVCGGAGALAYFQEGQHDPDFRRLGIVVGATFAVMLVLAIVLKMVANRQVRAAWAPLAQSLDAARWASKTRVENNAAMQAQKLSAAEEKRKHEVQIVRDRLTPQVKNARDRFDALTAALKSDYTGKVASMQSSHDATMNEAKSWLTKHRTESGSKSSTTRAEIDAKNAAAAAAEEKRYTDERKALANDWQGGLDRLSHPMHSESGLSPAPLRWDDPAWSSWQPTRTFPSGVRFGELKVDLQTIIGQIPQDKPFGLPIPSAFSLPAMLSFPAHGSLLIQADRIGRPAAIAIMQMVMARILTTLPPGRVKFTLLDPVGLGQNFAGFMHLADYDESLVSSRIWTDHEQIEKRLADLTDHMETVIQKYLRNEFATIDEYNAQAGELAEPYRYLVIADFPTGFQGDSFRRLASIATSGPRCGVYTIILRDTRQSLPNNSHFEQVQAESVNLVHTTGSAFMWKDEVFRQFPLVIDPPPDEDKLTELMHVVGKAAKIANRVEVPFELIAPPTPQEYWSLSSKDELRVPIGRMGATRLQQMRLGKGVAQHVLIAGKTGSGKSTLLHAMVTNLALWYSPREVEFYLIDFKKGVEFKTYGTHQLPHARAIAVESDREFGLSVLQRLDAELGRRGELFRKAGVQDLPSYRNSAGAVICPRTLLVIDEFQEFFSEDDKVGQEAGLLLDRLVRQGRAFGIHVLLGSQTIAGQSGLPRSTIGQMAVRIALQCSEADSQLILGDNNSAARLLGRPGEAIYNDAGGLLEGNSPFQIAWLPDAQREQYLIAVKNDEAKTKPADRLPVPIVFEGNAPADARRSGELQRLLDVPADPPPLAPVAVLGEAVAIKPATTITFRRQSGTNVLIIGQQEESALAIMNLGIISLAAQLPPARAKFYVFDGTPADSALAGSFAPTKAAVPNEVEIVDWRKTPDVINDIAIEVQRRLDADDSAAPAIYCFVYGLQRYRVLRKSEDDFGSSFSLSSDDDTPKPPNTGKQFADILREGPAVGVHVMVWADTPIAVDRTLDRGSMREFDHRVLFQMSANDSANLIDSPAANKLGFFRALAYSEEQGVVEKFRPYALPPADLLELVRSKLLARKA